MIEPITGLPEGTLGFTLSGHVTGEDYKNVLVPAIDQAIEDHESTKLLMHFGPDFESYSLGAAWDDAMVGLRQWNGFERAAIVSDVGWVRAGVEALGVFMPCPIQIFSNDQLDDARRWLSESLGSIHLDQDGDVITVRLLGKLEPSAYDGVDDDLSNLMSHTSHLRLLLDLREFDGWTGLTALGNHLSLFREHRRAPQRVAIVGDKAWQRIAQKVGSKFLDAESRFFEAAQIDEASRWIAAS